MKTGKTVKVLLTAATAAGMLAGCGSRQILIHSDLQVN